MAVAVWILSVSFALGFPQLYLATLHDSESGVTYSPVVLGFSLFVLAFFGVLIFLVSRGRNWARIVLLLLALTGLIAFLPSEEPTPLLELGLNIVDTALEAVAMYLLFTRPGSLWFRRRDE